MNAIQLIENALKACTLTGDELWDCDVNILIEQVSACATAWEEVFSTLQSANTSWCVRHIMAGHKLTENFVIGLVAVRPEGPGSGFREDKVYLYIEYQLALQCVQSFLKREVERGMVA